MRRASTSIAVAVTALCVAPMVFAVCLVEPVAIPKNLVTSSFGKVRSLPQYGGSQKTHWGVDFQARNPAKPNAGADLLAVDNGTIIGAGFWGSGYGNRVALRRENGDIVLYSHLASVEPSLKAGAAVGFKNVGNGPAVGSQKVAVGDKVGVAGGTADHMDSNQRAIHLHLEYITNYAGTKIRETNDGTNTTRSRYMRNALSYMCRSIAQAPGAGPVTTPNGGTVPVPQGGSVTADKNAPSSDQQVAEAAATQPNVTDRERYGVPDAPPYETYAGMSEAQIVEAEMLRRSLDTEWEQKLIEWGKRGLWMEIARMHGAKAWLENQIQEKNSRIEGMFASMLAFNTNEYFNPRLQAAYSRVEAHTSVNKVK